MLLCAGAGASRAEEGVSVIPDPSRLVAVGGSITEIIYALGEEKLLTARDSTSIYPPPPCACRMWATCARSRPKGFFR